MPDRLNTSSGELRTLEIASIEIDPHVEVRQVHAATVDDYAALERDGTPLPPIEVMDVDGRMIVVNGAHRLAARKEAGFSDVKAHVLAGTLRDATLRAASANSKNGRPLTRKEKRRAVLRFLEDDVWSDRSDREIAKRVGVSHTFVAVLRRELAAVAELDSEGGNVATDRCPATPATKTANTAASAVSEGAQVEGPHATGNGVTHALRSPERGDSATSDEEGEAGPAETAHTPGARQGLFRGYAPVQILEDRGDTLWVREVGSGRVREVERGQVELLDDLPGGSESDSTKDPTISSPEARPPQVYTGDTPIVRVRIEVPADTTDIVAVGGEDPAVRVARELTELIEGQT